MCTKQECIARLSLATPEIKKNFGVNSLKIFGSIARGDNHPGSDVDVFVDMPPKIFTILNLKEYLQELLGTAVDVIRKHSRLDPVLLQEIEKDGITIFS